MKEETKISTLELLQREESVFSRIPGICEAPPETALDDYAAWGAAYPDAAFCLQMRRGALQARWLGMDAELSQVFIRAYSRLLNGEDIKQVRSLYEKESNRYFQKHNWD